LCLPRTVPRRAAKFATTKIIDRIIAHLVKLNGRLDRVVEDVILLFFEVSGWRLRKIVRDLEIGQKRNPYKFKYEGSMTCSFYRVIFQL
jgi:hypothetical protein